MKKFTKIFLYFIICMIFLTTYVQAEDKACKISLSANKATLNPGDEVTITLTMSDITKTSGILNFISVLNFSNDIFEIVFEEDKELSEALVGTDFEGCEILYSGEKDNDATIKNPWYVLYLEDGDSKGIYASTSADPQIENQIIGRIKLKVKENVKSTKATVSLLETEVFDSETISNAGSTGDLLGYEIADSEIALQINGASGTEAPSSGNNTQNNVNIQGNVTNNVNNNKNTVNKSTNKQTQSANKANQNVPYTGIEDYIPFMFIAIIVAVMAYINYRKYKDI